MDVSSSSENSSIKPMNQRKKKFRNYARKRKKIEVEKYLELIGTKHMHNCTGDSKSRSTAGCIKDRDGIMIFEKDKVLERWTEYVG